ncbi:hypothetical protein ACQP25_44355 (plasmid) [Microtetraspora malaysiensis]|uniref:hypothetical protein n=1 Tax=Microtetraspora malaysiensis TaxID=161358 RepID=UPI003D93ACF5
MTALNLPTWNPERLAEALAEHGLTGQPRHGRRAKGGKRTTRPMTKTAITQLRRTRARTAAPAGTNTRRPTPLDRLMKRLGEVYRAEIDRRGGESSIDSKDNAVPVTIVDRNPTTRMVLMHAEGWRYYSSRYGHARASLSYLCGIEDGQRWAVRVLGTIETVADALAWITPAGVETARANGRKVVRQGDVYAIETTKAHDGKGDLPENHTWDPAARTLTHPEHGTLHLPHPVRFVPQRALGMGRGAGSAYAD